MPNTLRTSGTLPAILALVLLPLAVALAFIWVGDDVDQGFSQRIFYFHVPVAFATYACFAYGALSAAMYLWKHDARWDLRSYVGIHVGVIFGTLVLITGPIWAKPEWGRAWTWEPRLNLTAILWLIFLGSVLVRSYSENRDQGARLCLDILTSLLSAEQGVNLDGNSGTRGFFYHFLDPSTATRASDLKFWPQLSRWFKTPPERIDVEVSAIDTALLVAGCLAARNFFDRPTGLEKRVRKLSTRLYERVDWTWLLGRDNLLRMGWKPESGLLESRFQGLTEALLLYVIALGSPTHAISPESWGSQLQGVQAVDLYGEHFVAVHVAERQRAREDIAPVRALATIVGQPDEERRSVGVRPERRELDDVPVELLAAGLHDADVGDGGSGGLRDLRHASNPLKLWTLCLDMMSITIWTPCLDFGYEHAGIRPAPGRGAQPGDA